MTSRLKAMSAMVSVGPQLRPEDIAALAVQGFGSIINNRPDDEEPGQPASAEIEAAAKASGLGYLHVPVHGMPDDRAVTAVAAQLIADATQGARTVLFCRSGMRSAAIWAMVQSVQGADPEQLRSAAAAAGYDLSRLPL